MSARRILLALGFALLVSGVATWAASRRLATSQVLRVANLGYVAAVHAVEPGSVLTAKDLQIVQWPGDHPMEGAYARMEDVVGREALYPLTKGQPLSAAQLSTPGAGVGLASKIPVGMRAVALRSDEVVGVAGFLIPGSHVDVLVTYRAGSNPDPITATVLQNVPVVAVGHQAEPDTKSKTSDVTIVTLLLGPNDAERAVLASAQGQIHFVLRNGADDHLASSAPVQLSRLTNASSVSKPAVSRAPLRVASLTVTHEVETVLGNQSGVDGPR